MTKTLALLAASAAVALAAPAFATPANTTAPSVTSKTAPAAAAKAPAKAPVAKVKGPAITPPTTAAGKACSAQADAQSLHGKARKAFRSKCEAGIKASTDKTDAKPVATPAPKATSAPK